ncbi:NAD(P)-dependent oxidoreductase [Salinibaculum salinum]|uniref:NAD(P)-dependent oxidoreductase n=1 Tax=Salinibaculum salinum TaxID=3131996 RepID=UPI0030EC72F7
MEQIGFIGLGAMGEPMAWHVADEYDLGVYNRTASRMDPFADAGVRTYDTPAALAADSEAIVTMLTGPEALRAVTLGEDGVLAGLREGTVVVDASTVSQGATEEVAAAVREAGGAYVDAPVLGTIGPAESGDLLVLAGADEDIFAETKSLLSVFGDVRHVGGVGDGTSMKLTTNLMLGVLMEGFAEALAFADGQDLPLEEVLDVIQGGVLGAPLYDYKGPVVRERDFTPQFPVDLLFKDLNLALDAAGETEVPLPATAATREAASATRALGHGGEDMMALLKHLEAVTGRTVGE